MRLGSVDFPSDLVEARAADSLVVFAGAGVSIPPPSNLPDFNKLAIELARGTTTLEKDEPVDRFLGRLEPGLRIHEHTRDRLRSPQSKPNPLHFSLLKLFGGASAVRLVTTNFDNHFAAAAAEMWASDSPEMFAAPALPAGADFLGVVHLHGSVTRDPRRMVLTDVDFGKAYLTEGWARRFLQEMFSRYAVLFVGYSHNDPVMHYLARGLPSSAEGRRFALTPEGQDRFWKHLGIIALTYRKRRGKDPHRELGIALSRWAALAAERPLDKRERIREITSKPPPGAGEDHDYLVNALSDEYTARFFAEFAQAPEWFDWAQGREAFLRLFRAVRDAKPTDEQLASWFAENFAIGHAGSALEWIARNRLKLGPVCWLAVAHAIFRQMHSGAGCPELDKWVPLLIQWWPGYTDLLEDILSRCRYPEDGTAALLLFKHLLRPEAELKPDLARKVLGPAAAADVDLELDTIGDGHSIREAWQGCFRPNLQDLAGPLAAIATASLEEMSLLSNAYEKRWDLVSMRFPDLRATNYGGQSGLGALVEVARETLLWLIQNIQKRADGLIEAWWNAGSIVLQRLAVFGAAQSAQWTADDKLGWLLERGLLYKLGFWQEASSVLGVAFRDASPEMKDLVVVAVLAGRTNDDEDRMHERLWALKRADPDCARIEEELSKFAQPPERVAEPEPTPPSPRDLLATPPADQVEGLLTYEQNHAESRDRRGLTTAVQMAVAESPDWGIKLAVALRERHVWETGLWGGVVAGWNGDKLSFNQWTSVLNLLLESRQITSSALDEVVDLLERRTSGDSNPFNGSLLGFAVRVGMQVWTVLETREDKGKPESKDWLAVAINYPGGKLAKFFLRLLWQARKETADGWRGLTDDFRLYLDSIIGGDSWAAEMARVVVAAHLHVLFALDARWTNENMFGLFDWSANPRRAQQAWHGYLTWGRWNNDLLEKMLPHCRQTFARIEGELGDRKVQFSELMANIALYGAVDPMESGWLPEFVKAAGMSARKDWASALRRSLEEFPAGKRPELWARWMKDYWEFRLGASPSLDPGELVRMVEWSFELEDAFPDAVGLILKGPAPESRREPCLRLQRSGIWRTYPRESALLLRFLVRSQNGTYGDYVAKLVRELASLGAETVVLVDICQRLAELGDRSAGDLKKYVESQAGTPTS